MAGRNVILDAAIILDTDYLDSCCSEYGLNAVSKAALVTDIENNFRCRFFRLHFVPNLKAASSVTGSMALGRVKKR